MVTGSICLLDRWTRSETSSLTLLVVKALPWVYLAAKTSLKESIGMNPLDTIGWHSRLG